MRAVAIEQGRLVPVTVPMPHPGDGEVLISVAYAGVNRADVMQVAGSYPPPEDASPLPGLEVSGVIAALGPHVVGWSVGERVCALLAGGGYAEYVTVPAAQLLAVPSRLGLAEAATLPEGAATAAMALALEAKLTPGERVLVHGGASGTGNLIAQVARAWGAEVYATAGTDEKCAVLAGLGITCINHRRAPFADTLREQIHGEGVDIIIDILGGPQLATHLKLLRPNGRLVLLALMEGSAATEVKLGGVLMKHLRISGATLRSRNPAAKAALVEHVHRFIWPHVATGAIQPLVDQLFPLELAEKAHERMQERLHLGKILLEVAPENESLQGT